MKGIAEAEVQHILSSIADRVLRHLKKSGYLDKDGEVVVNPMIDPLFADSASLSQATLCSFAGKIAFGPNAGKHVTRIRSGFGYEEEMPLLKGKRCYSMNGFSLHAGTAINSLQRERLTQLLQYMSRGSLSNERVEITEDGRVQLQLKTKWSDGTSHLLFTPEEFLEKLSALIPPPRSHLVRWGGCFAPNSKVRKAITLRPEKKKGFQFKEEGKQKGSLRCSAWSCMLARVFKIDVMHCEVCGGDMKVICAVIKPESIARYLGHIGIDSRPPVRAPPRAVQEPLCFEYCDETPTFESYN